VSAGIGADDYHGVVPPQENDATVRRDRNPLPPRPCRVRTFLTDNREAQGVGRAFGTPCLHEHACVRCSLLRPDPAQRPRLEEIRSNLVEDRIIEAKLHGWLGEVEGLPVSLAGVNDKLTQIDTSTPRAVDLGTPSLPTNSCRR
jgi:hypothetical protein